MHYGVCLGLPWFLFSIDCWDSVMLVERVPTQRRRPENAKMHVFNIKSVCLQTILGTVDLTQMLQYTRETVRWNEQN
jgi:hypothetical protein